MNIQKTFANIAEIYGLEKFGAIVGHSLLIYEALEEGYLFVTVDPDGTTHQDRMQLYKEVCKNRNAPAIIGCYNQQENEIAFLAMIEGYTADRLLPTSVKHLADFAKRNMAEIRYIAEDDVLLVLEAKDRQKAEELMQSFVHYLGFSGR